MKTILCYGDSNTYGSDPSTGIRFDMNTRWGSVLRTTLGADYWVIEEGLGGRTTVFDDPVSPGRCGKDYLLPCLQSHNPLDLVAVMLGTNDLKHRFGASASDIALGAGFLVNMILRSECGPQGSAPKVLLICPPPLAKLTDRADDFAGAAEKSRQMAKFYQQQAELYGCAFLDAGQVITSSDVDGIHFAPESQRALGRAAAAIIKTLV